MAGLTGCGVRTYLYIGYFAILLLVIGERPLPSFLTNVMNEMKGSPLSLENWAPLCCPTDNQSGRYLGGMYNCELLYTDCPRGTYTDALIPFDIPFIRLLMRHLSILSTYFLLT